ncbi:hypothetical protein CLOM_g13211 [Closterium sp. NIES-68]|nr:hypothetical protein CLOM_g13211 [Closterium sp. NIES-68]GJP81441.1 hypothetical protein CLOP_g11591 [Closterium sp. NIES-67]
MHGVPAGGDGTCGMGKEAERGHGGEKALGEAALFSATVTSCLFLLPAFVTPDWIDTCAVLALHPMVDAFLPAAFEGVTQALLMLHHLLSPALAPFSHPAPPRAPSSPNPAPFTQPPPRPHCNHTRPASQLARSSLLACEAHAVTRECAGEAGKGERVGEQGSERDGGSEMGGGGGRRRLHGGIGPWGELHMVVRQCEAALQVLQVLCRPDGLGALVLKHKDLVHGGGLLRLLLAVLRLPLPPLLPPPLPPLPCSTLPRAHPSTCTPASPYTIPLSPSPALSSPPSAASSRQAIPPEAVVSLEALVAALSRCKCRAIHMLLTVSEADGSSFLDDVAASPGSLQLAQDVTQELLSLLHATAIANVDLAARLLSHRTPSSAASPPLLPDPSSCPRPTPSLHPSFAPHPLLSSSPSLPPPHMPLPFGRLSVNVLRAAEVLSDDSSFRPFFMLHAAPLLVRLLSLPAPAFSSRWLHGPLSRALAAREVDACVLFRPFPSLGLALALSASASGSHGPAAASVPPSQGEQRKEAQEVERGSSGVDGIEDLAESSSSGPFSFSEGGLVAATRAPCKEASGTTRRSGSRGATGRGTPAGDGGNAEKPGGDFLLERVDEWMVGGTRSEKRKRGRDEGKGESEWKEGLLWLEGGCDGAAAEAEGVSGEETGRGGGRSGAGRGGGGGEGRGAGEEGGGEGGVGSGWQSVGLLVKLVANLHCHDPLLCPGQDRNHFLHLVIAAICQECPPSDTYGGDAPREGVLGKGVSGEGVSGEEVFGEGAAGGAAGSSNMAEEERQREQAEAAVRICENLYSLIDFAATMPATHVSDDDVILISQFASALHAAICHHPAHQEECAVREVRARHDAWLAALQGRWDGQERWLRLQPADGDGEDGDGDGDGMEKA